MITQKKVKILKQEYPQGTRIQVIRMGPDPHPIPSGMCGMVTEVDDIGTVHCRFDNGRCLGLIPDVDSFHIVRPEKTVQEVLASMDTERDIFKLLPERGEAVEIYFNPDSTAGGQFVFNYFSMYLLLEAEKSSNGNITLFFDYLQDFCLQKSVDIDDEPETIKAAAEELMGKADFYCCNKETMDGLMKAAHVYEEKKQSSIANKN